MFDYKVQVAPDVMQDASDVMQMFRKFIMFFKKINMHDLGFLGRHTSSLAMLSLQFLKRLWNKSSKTLADFRMFFSADLEVVLTP